MMNLFYILFLLFVLKLIWNLFVPVTLEIQFSKWKESGGTKPGAVSMAIGVEVMLLVLLCLTDLLSTDPHWPAYLIFIWGGIAIVCSYLVGALAGTLMRKWLTRE